MGINYTTTDLIINGNEWKVPGEVADHVAKLERLLRAYVKDEDRFNRGEGEPYGSITTETGAAARLALKR